jgi:hypothetical protein
MLWLSSDGVHVAKPNYQFEKRQRELAKQRKKEEKARRKAAGVDEPAGEEEAPSTDSPPQGSTQAQD